MKLHKYVLVGAIITLLGFSFQSCSEDYRFDTYQKEATLDFWMDSETNNGGYFRQTVRIFDRDIKEYQPSREDLVGIKLINSWLVISKDDRNVRVNNLRIDLNGGSTFYQHVGVVSGGYVIENSGYYNFMRNVMASIEYYGYADITVSGNANRNWDIIPFDFNNDLDIIVRQ